MIQRVKKAHVEVNSQTVGSIDQGLLVFLGIHVEDTADAIPWLVEKCLHLRIFEDEDKKMNRSVLDVNGSILLVSQFTLYGDCQKGRRPSFTQAALPTIARPLYDAFI
ncbi:MAG TPA: D-aminoacyl-tRNA deacylase, partial [Chlamydiales bacterium]|nr:D-aminoacyl-tRNA deacylase [Chlamydiales bacterium]